ncbi:MAG: MFS transporter [Planctomycetaceae bacterium]|nr:MFS transporter [Planctomycetaceae bacterium]
MAADNQTASIEPQEPGIPYWTKAVALFFLGWIFIYATRNILSASMNSIQQEFGLTQSQLGLVNSVFFFTYTFAQIPSGMLGDRFGLKRMLIIGFLLFGIFTGMTGLATSFAVLVLMRALVGIGQGTYYGPQYALSSAAIPLKHRGFGSAIINSGMAFGISLGLIGAGFIINTLGLNWRYSFYAFAIPTVVIGLLFQFVIKEPPRAVEAQPAADATSPAATTVKPKLSRNIIAIYVMVFCSLFGFFVIQTWLPYYLQNERNIAAGQVGFVSSLVAWASIPGALIFSRMSDKLRRRKLFIVLLVVLALFSIMGCVYFEQYSLMITCLVIYGLTGKLALDPILVASVADNAASGNRGTIFSVYNFVGMSSSIVAPYLAGFLSDTTGSLASAFYLSGGLLLIGLVTILFVFKDTLKQQGAA